jgi:hypothetical protein
MSTTKTTPTAVGEHAHHLRARVAELTAKADQHRADQRAAGGDVRNLEAQLAGALREDVLNDRESSKTSRDLTAKLARARERAEEPWAARIAATESVIRDARRQLAAFVEENVEALLDELRPDAEEAAAAVTAAVRAVPDAMARWHEVAARVGAVLDHVDGLDRGDLNTLHVQPAIVQAPGSHGYVEVESDEVPLPFVAERVLDWHRTRREEA